MQKSNNINQTKKFTILIFNGYYLPGYLGGGPIRSIVNLVASLSDQFNFLIITRDRDLGTVKAYPNIKVDEWIQVGAARIFYASPSKQTIWSIFQLLSKTKFDLLYLNSFFDFNFSIKPILLSHLILAHKKRVLLAPRGELSDGALGIKSFKKTIYIFCAKQINLYNSTVFQGSTKCEVEEIINVFNRHENNKIKSVCDISNLYSLSTEVQKNERKIKLSAGALGKNQLKVCFLSRICPKKNLEYAINVLSNVKTEVEMNIYGPIEDLVYWRKCENRIKSLPKNVSVKYHGSVPHEEVYNTLSGNDIFFLPTLNENFGHVFIEAWGAGIPILISDQTPWRNLISQGIGWDLSLDEPTEFSRILEEVSTFSDSDWNSVREKCFEKVKSLSKSDKTISEYKDLFCSLINT